MSGRPGESKTIKLRPYLLAQQIKIQDNGSLCYIGRIVHNDSSTIHHVSNYFHSLGYPGSLAHGKPGIWSCVDMSRQSCSQHRPKDPPQKEKDAYHV